MMRSNKSSDEGGGGEEEEEVPAREAEEAVVLVVMRRSGGCGDDGDSPRIPLRGTIYSALGLGGQHKPKPLEEECRPRSEADDDP